MTNLDVSLLTIEKHIGQQLKRRRQALHLRQYEVAAKVGITTQQVHKYEKGIDRISASRLLQFSHLLAIPTSYFYEGLESKKPLQNKVLIRCKTPKGERFIIQLDNSDTLFSDIRLMPYG